GRNDRPIVLDRRDDGLGVRGRKAVREVDVGSVEAGEHVGLRDRERVPTHVRDLSRAQADDLAAEQSEPAPALLARSEQELHAEADAERRSAGGDALAQLLGDPAALELDGSARRIAYAGN